MSETTNKPPLPDHLSIDPRSPHHAARGVRARAASASTASNATTSRNTRISEGCACRTAARSTASRQPGDAQAEGGASRLLSLARGRDGGRNRPASCGEAALAVEADAHHDLLPGPRATRASRRRTVVARAPRARRGHLALHLDQVHRRWLRRLGRAAIRWSITSTRRSLKWPSDSPARHRPAGTAGTEGRRYSAARGLHRGHEGDEGRVIVLALSGAISSGIAGDDALQLARRGLHWPQPRHRARPRQVVDGDDAALHEAPPTRKVITLERPSSCASASPTTPSESARAGSAPARRRRAWAPSGAWARPRRRLRARRPALQPARRRHHHRRRRRCRLAAPPPSGGATRGGEGEQGRDDQGDGAGRHRRLSSGVASRCDSKATPRFERLCINVPVGHAVSSDAPRQPSGWCPSAAPTARRPPAARCRPAWAWPANVAAQHEGIGQRRERLEHDQLAGDGGRQALAGLVPAQRAEPGGEQADRRHQRDEATTVCGPKAWRSPRRPPANQAQVSA